MREATAVLRERIGMAAKRLGRCRCPQKRADLAAVAGRTPRTIRNWKTNPRGGRRGRPPHSLEERDRARRLVLGQMRIQGFSAHGRAIERGLKGHGVPTRLIRSWVREIKATIERDALAYWEERMIRFEVPYSGLVTAIDTTQVTREPLSEEADESSQETMTGPPLEGPGGVEPPGSGGETRSPRGSFGLGSPWKGAGRAGRRRVGRAIQAMMAVDVASMFKLGFKVLHAPTGEDVIILLTAIKEARGYFPLVVISDNGPENVNAEVAAFFEKNQIVHLRNVPHTPRHNPVVERAHREVKAEATLDMAVMAPATPLFERVRKSVAQAVDRLNNGRLRESRGWKTAAMLDTELRAPYALVDRDAFYAAARAAARAARNAPGSTRDKQLAERWALLRVMEGFGLVKLFRGGVPITASEAERIT